MYQKLFVWPLFWLVMGFVLGGSYVWGWNYGPKQHPALHSNDQHESHSNQPAKPSNAEPKGTASAPFFVQVIPSPKPAEERTQEAEDREDKKDADRWLVRWTFALFAATIGLILATGVLGYFAYRQAGDMKASVNAAEKAADAATLSAKAAIGMELPVIRVERFPGLMNVAEPPSLEKPLRGSGIITSNVPQQFSVLSSLEFRNVGRTPAFPVKLMTGWKVGSDLPAEPDYFNSVNSSSAAIIKPDGTFQAAARMVVELSCDDRDRLSKKTAFIWLCASLHYLDFLNNPHEARFCWRSTTGVFGSGGAFPASYTTHS